MRIAALLISLIQSAPPVTYDVSFPNAVHHEAEIVATFAGVPAGPLEVWMSRSSPGRYAVHEFAKNVYNLRAEDGRGRPLTATPANPYSWRVGGHDGTVKIRYTLFGDRADGTYAQIDRSHAHLNAPATFLWAKGFDHRAVRVSFTGLPTNWRVATQLKPTADPAAFTAPGLQYFMDSPIEAGPLDIRSWLVGNGIRSDTIRLAIHHTGTAVEVTRFVDMIKRIIPEQAGVFGELAPFDYGSYTFLSDYLPWASADGMEHRNSTVLSGTRPLSTGMMDNFGTVAHEFFHSWNVERIRPRSLEPFNFVQANMSGELWLAEGFTNYYEGLTSRRAGFTNDEEFARSLSGGVNGVVNGIGRRYFSAIDMSRQAPFVDAAQSIDPQNRVNTFISYYTFGEAIGLGLDLTLRSRFGTVSLDDFMRAMWRKFGKTERPYTLGDVRRTLGEVTRDPVFATDYFARHIAGREVPDYRALLATVGFVLRKAQAGKAWLGDGAFAASGDGVMLSTPARVGQPLYLAGVERGDVIKTLGGQAIRTNFDLDSVTAAHRPGDSVEIIWESRGSRVTSRVVFAENPRVEVVTGENGGVAVTPGALEARRRWLASKAGAAGAPR